MYSELSRKHRKIQIAEAFYSTLMKVMWTVGGITIVGDFITWSLWNDYELNSPIDIRMNTAWAGCGWMAVCGVAALVAFIIYHVCAVKAAKSEEDVSPEGIDWENVLQPVSTRICWYVGIGVALFILIGGNILCWRAVPVSKEGREAIMSYVQTLMPDAEVEVTEKSGHRYVLDITGSTEHSTEFFSVDYMQNEDLLDQENFSLYLTFDCRYYDVQQMMNVVENYINVIDSEMFSERDITYVSSEFGKIEEELIARTATMVEAEDYEDQVEYAGAAGKTTVHFAVEDSIINSYDGSSYKMINIRIHAINMR